ncbi:MAG: tetratricopeptide repeat protein [Acidobacteriota bacterium]|nr:tetratricopeptide repeat protein [Acidobacteriota bacterium]
MPWVIFFVALAVRLLHLWQIKPSPFFDVLLGDAHGYDEWARRLAAGDWVGTEVFYQAPLYPYFVGGVYALFGRDLLILRVCQAVIGSASCALLGMTGARLFSKPVGAIAGLGLALYAPAIFFDGLIQKSVLDMFFVCLSLWLMARILGGGATPANWLALGLAMGGLALTRENALVFIAVIVAWIIVRARTGPGTSPVGTRGTRGTLGTLGTFVLGLAVVLLPVAARNFAVGGGFYLTTSQFGSNLYIGNNPTADGTYASIRFGRGAPEFERIDATEVAEEAAGHALTPSEVSSFWTGRVVDYITSQPVDWIRLLGRKVLLLVNATEMLDTESQESYAEWSWPLAIGGWIGHFGVLVPLAVAGVFVTWPLRRNLWLLYAMTLAYAASVVVFYVFARYRYPLVPFLLLFSAAAVVAPFDSPFDFRPRNWIARSRAQGRQQWLAAAAVVGAAIVANWPLLSPTLMRSITETNLGTALQTAGRHDEAVAHHQRAIALAPDHAPAYNNLGASLRAAGRLDEAIAAYRQALALRTDFASASYNLANALLAQGDPGASVEQFRQALQSADTVEARNNLGIALAGKGDAAGAVAEFRAALTLDDRSVQAHRNLGNMLIDMGNRAEGMAHLERAVALAPSEPDATYDIGAILLEEGNFAGAAQRFRAVLAARPGWAEAHNHLGIALAQQGRMADALAEFERAVTARPDYAEARVNRDQARAVLGRKP